MKKVIALVVACGALVAQSAFAVSALRISQIYGGGGATTGSPTYNQDYVEIYNSSSFAVNISGWTIEYGSVTGNWGSSSANIFTFPTPTNIPACSYILVAMTASTAGGTLPVTPDYSGTLTMSATSGKVALFNAVNTNLACGSELPATLQDKVAFGTATGNCPEGTVVGLLSTTTGAVRNTGGAADTDNNSLDFTIVTAPVPRNSASGLNPGCVVIGVEESTWSTVKSLFQ